jgi:hypothetical protein
MTIRLPGVKMRQVRIVISHTKCVAEKISYKTAIN